MQVGDIKYKADQIFEGCKIQVIKACLVLGLVSTIFTYVRDSLQGTVGTIISFVIIVLTVTISHGYVVAGLKAVNQQGQQIEPVKGGLAGLYRIKELFSTYFIYYAFYFVLMMITVLVAILIMAKALPDTFLSPLTWLNLSADAVAILTNSVSSEFLLSILLIILLFSVLTIWYYSNFWLAPYILEKYNIRGVQALRESFILTKGYRITYILLHLSFIGWILLSGVVVAIIDMVLPIPILISLISMVVGIIMYNAKLQVCLAVLYEEIDLAREVVVVNEDGEE